MQADPFRGPLEGEGHDNQDFFGPWNGIKIIKSKCHIKNWYIGNFMYTSFCILYSVFYILYSVLYVVSFMCMGFACSCVGIGMGMERGGRGREALPPPTTLTLLCTEQFRNQQRYVKIRLWYIKSWNYLFMIFKEPPLANILKIFSLGNRSNISKFINDDICFMFYLLFFAWNQPTFLFSYTLCIVQLRT